MEIPLGNSKKGLTFLGFIKDVGLMLLGIGLAAIGLESFLLPNHFIDGGVTGISMLISQLFGVNLSVLIVFINLPFLAIAYRTLSKAFVLKGMIAITVLAIVIQFVHIGTVTNDHLLASLFGGICLGAGIGFTMRGGGVLDGTEMMAVLGSRRSPFTVGEVILIMNAIIFTAVAIAINVEIAMYSMLTYLAASRTVNFIVEGIEEYTGIFIISEKNQEIREVIINTLGRGVTIYKGKRGYTDVEQDILLCVVTRLEIMNVTNMVRKLDPHAFIFMHSIHDASGGMIKRRAV